MTNLADLAIRYSQQFKADVIPVVPEGKCPPKGMTRKRASQDPDVIRRMFTDYPSCGIGMIIPEHLVVLDLERDGAGKPLGGLPPTAVAKSRGRTGRHYFFRTFRRIPTRIRIRKDVDILGTGHIVVLPSTNDPERHWMIAPEDEQLALAPSWLRELAQERPRRQRQPLSMPSAPDRSGIGERTELGDLLTEFFTEERNLREILAHLGMPRDAEIGGRSFSCPCCPEQRASASLWRAKNGQIVVKVWHAARDGGGGKWNCPANEYSLLPEIYHAQQTREWRKLGGAELAAWSLRLVRDAGVVRLKNAQPQLPGLPRNARYLVQQFAEVISLAEALAGRSIAVAFTRRFAAAYAGISESAAKKYWALVQSIGAVVRAGSRRGRTGLWTFATWVQTTTRPSPGSSLLEEFAGTPASDPNEIFHLGPARPVESLERSWPGPAPPQEARPGP